MNLPAIKDALRRRHHDCSEYIAALTAMEFTRRRNDKWTAGQQLAHLYRSIQPLNWAFMIPKPILGLIFGKANRESRSFEALVEKYLAKLADGGRASGRFIPPSVPAQEQTALVARFNREAQKLEAKLDRFTESDLDQLILPHPLLGKLTIREMLYFTIYHAQHHLNLTKRDLM
jgi:hypothetical protein